MVTVGGNLCSVLTSRDGFNAKRASSEIAPSLRREMARALEKPNRSRVAQYSAKAASGPRQRRRTISHTGKTGAIAIWLGVIGSDVS
jgi:hypothetical protein